MAAFSQLGPSQGALSAKVGEAIEAGEKFVEIFYETFDRRRQVVQLYSLIKAHLHLSHFSVFSAADCGVVL